MSIHEIASMAPVIPVLTISVLEHAVPLARALVAGGLGVLEITLRTPIALAAIDAIRREVAESIVGAGTLTRAIDFAAAVRAGAQFAVTPGLTSELAAAAHAVSLPLLPGVMTPTELIAARGAGFDVLKLFPAVQAGGIAMVRALAAPFPDVVFCPTGGITRASAADYLTLPNVICVGGSWLAPASMLSNRDWAGIEALARDAASLGGRASENR
ncbi:MAG TPA: bifunctional 4-hydroxy-2-oxoglutarate aldolase/2-dehydro-3-deoxy-phosphogluconate aldolase [Steroidobacteraceae bacterium]